MRRYSRTGRTADSKQKNSLGQSNSGGQSYRPDFTMTLEMSQGRRSRRRRAMTTLWSCLRRTGRRSQPTWTYRRANTMCQWEFGRASTLLPIASCRKARVVGLACTRICPRLLSPSRNPSNEQNSLRNQKLFWSPPRRKFGLESKNSAVAR